MIILSDTLGFIPVSTGSGTHMILCYQLNGGTLSCVGHKHNHKVCRPLNSLHMSVVYTYTRKDRTNVQVFKLYIYQEWQLE